jgi:carbamoyl-phosphate synthase large subunit
MPYIYVKAAFDEKLPRIKKKINPLPNGLAWVRGMDVDPVLTTAREIASYEEELIRRLKKIKEG